MRNTHYSNGLIRLKEIIMIVEVIMILLYIPSVETDLAQKVNGSSGNILSSWNNNHFNGLSNKITPSHHSWGPSPVQSGWGSAGKLR
jgi:hypothetical protein